MHAPTKTTDLPTVNLDELERLAIRQAMALCEGNIVLAAKALGMSASTLYRRLHVEEILHVSQIDAPQTVVV